MAGDATQPALELDGLEKRFGTVAAIDGVSLTVPRAAILALLGPSGCGKTTILRAIAGFVEPDRGNIRLAGRDVTRLPPERRGTGMVFQNYALFPHMTVAQNVAFGLQMHKVPRAQREALVADALSLVQLSHMAARYPSQLSGGQQQRAALARSVVIRPDILLLDEPFGALDENLRETLQIELRKLQQRLGVTTVIVTHDQAEAMILADQIAVLRAGQIEQLASPATVYDRPATRFVAGFMGVENILDAVVDAGGVRIGPYWMELPPGGRSSATCGEAWVAARAESIGLRLPDAGDGWPGSIVFSSNLGGRLLYEVEVAGVGRIKVERPRAAGIEAHATGTAVTLQLDARSCTLLRE
jgi:ABC-type Fe3+/spermidine/putrescine transport system ATPase subunit